MAKELIVTDLARAFLPQSAIDTLGDRDHWRSVPYTSGDREGTLLVSYGTSRPADLRCDPGLRGWYKVYVCLPSAANTELKLRLSSDGGFDTLIAMRKQTSPTFLEEYLWRCCDMTDQSLIISRQIYHPTYEIHAMLAWLRFVPMTDEEVADWQTQFKSHRRIYATDDIHNVLCHCDISREENWLSVVQPYRDSDVQWLSLEDIDSFIRGKTPVPAEEFAFWRGVDRRVQEQAEGYASLPTLTKLVAAGKAQGLNMSLSLRMGAWTMGFPYDNCYFDNPFYFENPHLRCVSRGGEPIPSLSYAYPEVRQYMIGRLLALASTGCDAITLIGHRGGPYVLFEKPVEERFVAQYGFLPQTLPLDDERLNRLHCQIMAEFFAELREALDAAFPHRHVQVHLRTLVSVYDSRYFALDCRTLASRGLVDAIISYPQRFRETLYPSLLQDGRLDPQAHLEQIYQNHAVPYQHINDQQLLGASVPDSAGTPRTPLGLKECVAQWQALEQEFGVPVYMEIMPRVMPPEQLRQRAVELYDCGAQGIALWDTYGRVVYPGFWQVGRYLGHKEKLAQMQPPYYQTYRLHRLAGMNLTTNHPSWGG